MVAGREVDRVRVLEGPGGRERRLRHARGRRGGPQPDGFLGPRPGRGAVVARLEDGLLLRRDAGKPAPVRGGGGGGAPAAGRERAAAAARLFLPRRRGGAPPPRKRR